MTDPDEKPSFLARLAVVVTVGVVVLQLVLCVEGVEGKINSGRSLYRGWFFVCLLPTISHIAVAGLYYLIKGNPINTDAVMASRLYRVWAVSAIGGAIYCLLV